MKKTTVRTDFGHLMRLAKAEGDAKKSGDPERIKAAEEAHQDYREQCLQSEEMSLGMTYGALGELMR